MAVALLPRVRRSLAWRLRNLADAIYSTKEILFWSVGKDEIAPDLSEAKAEGVIRALRLTVRKATPDDLPLFRRYHARCGRRLGWGRRRLMFTRWAAGDECYIALDREGEIVAQVWVAYERCLIEGRWRRVPPDEVYYYGADTRQDRQGSMGYMACSVAAGMEFVPRRGRMRAVAWVEPRLFAKFQFAASWLGMSKPRPAWLERHTRICGLRFCQITEVGPDWEYTEPSSKGSGSRPWRSASRR